MERVIVYLDDADHARARLLDPALPGPRPRHWILVACPPRMTRHLSKWVNHRARESWRAKWSQKLYDSIVPALRARGDQVTTVLASQPLPDLTRELQATEEAAQVLDLRRPRLPHEPGGEPGWSAPTRPAT